MSLLGSGGGRAREQFVYVSQLHACYVIHHVRQKQKQQTKQQQRWVLLVENTRENRKHSTAAIESRQYFIIYMCVCEGWRAGGLVVCSVHERLDVVAAGLAARALLGVQEALLVCLRNTCETPPRM